MTENLPAVLRGEAEPKRVGDRQRTKLLEAADRIVTLEARVAYLEKDRNEWENSSRTTNIGRLWALGQVRYWRGLAGGASIIATVLCVALIAAAAFIQAGCGR